MRSGASLPRVDDLDIQGDDDEVKLARGFVVSGLVVLVAACSDAPILPQASGTSTSGTSGSGGCNLQGSTHVPPRNGGAAPEGGEVVFAIDSINFGDRDSMGNYDPAAWQQLGYDIDCRITTASSTDVCKPPPDGQVWPDAPGGRDNNFGARILPYIVGTGNFDPNGAIAAGDWTAIVRFSALGTAPNQTSVEATLYDGRGLGHQPSFDGSDVWPVAAPRPLSDSYVAAGTWVSAPPVTVRLKVIVGGLPLYLTLHHTVFTAVFAADLSKASSGQLSGILDKDQFRAEVDRHQSNFSVDLGVCILENDIWSSMADILDDGTQDPTKVCQCISAGIGFTLRRVQLGKAVEPEVVPPDPCAPQGP